MNPEDTVLGDAGIGEHGTYFHATRLLSERHPYLLELPPARSEHSMNIFYIIGVVVVVIVVAGFLGLRV